MLKLLSLLALTVAGSLCGQTADFDLTFAIPKAYTNILGETERSITYDKSDKHPFYVVLSNKSGVVQHLWEEWNSWGYYNLYFEVIDSTGKTWAVRRSDEKAWTINAPGYFVLEPSETHVFKVMFPDDWKDLPKVENLAATYVTLRAIYEIPPDGMIRDGNGVVRMDTTTKDSGVWTGKAISNPVKVRLFGEARGQK